jgi:hypothetical protein
MNDHSTDELHPVDESGGLAPLDWWRIEDFQDLLPGEKSSRACVSVYCRHTRARPLALNG